jgi:hypothetical protein
MSQKLLEEFEAQLDVSARRSTLLRLPLGTILTGLYHTIDRFAHGDLEGIWPRIPNLAITTVETLAFLGSLLELCPRNVLQRDSLRAWRSCQRADPKGIKFEWLREYAQFCDVMPKVRRGYFHVEGNAQIGFTLTIPDEVASYQVRDIILNELAQERISHSRPDVDTDFRKLIESFPSFDAEFFASQMVPHYRHDLESVTEPFVITPEGFEASTGVALDEYRRFRAACSALAFIFEGLHAYAMLRISIASSSEKEHLLAVYHGSHSVLLPREVFRDVVIKVSGLTNQHFDRLLFFFTIDAASSQPMECLEDTYFPPLLLTNDWLLFNPLALVVMMNARNLLLALSRVRPQQFNAISHHSEPQLLNEAEEVFRQIPGLILVRNKEWQAGRVKGEIDLLAFHPSENAALVVQAKGGIPAAGARATRSREVRAEEGLEQLTRFRRLPPADQDRILSDSLGNQVKNVLLVDVLMTRTNFGTARIWNQLGPATALNLPLLRALMKKHQVNGQWRLEHFRKDTEEITEKIIKMSRSAWRPSSIRVNNTPIYCDWLDFSDVALRQIREGLWSNQSYDEIFPT